VLLTSVIQTLLPPIISIVSILTNSKPGIPGVGDMSFPQFVCSVIILASVAEELFIRGLIQGYLNPLRTKRLDLGRISLSLPVLVSATLFGSMHFSVYVAGGSLAFTLCIIVMTTVMGLMAAYYRERTESLIPPVAVHMTANIVGSVLLSMLPKVFGP
jgi:membrane protease YdiL (CAAX protease family)